MPNKMNTISVNTGTALTGGEAEKLINHLRPVYSREIEFKAMPIMRFVQFAKIKTELNVQPGLTIQMMTYANLKKGGALTEGTRMETQALSSVMKSLTVGERGNAIAVSELALRASFTDIMADATTLLGRDMALTLDCELRDVVLTGATINGQATSTIFGRKDNTAAKIAARANITDANILSVCTIKDGVEILATTNTPKIEGSYYICFVHPHQSRNLRDDPSWIEASKYGAPDQLFTGEIGRIDDVRFIETTLMCNGSAPTDDPAFKAELKAGAALAPADTDVFQAVLSEKITMDMLLPFL
jgi:N4-gp56 family major capsid protein